MPWSVWSWRDIDMGGLSDQPLTPLFLIFSIILTTMHWLAYSYGALPDQETLLVHHWHMKSLLHCQLLILHCSYCKVCSPTGLDLSKILGGARSGQSAITDDIIGVSGRDVPGNHPVLGICRVSHYPVLPGPGKIMKPSKFNFFKVKYWT